MDFISAPPAPLAETTAIAEHINLPGLALLIFGVAFAGLLLRLFSRIAESRRQREEWRPRRSGRTPNKTRAPLHIVSNGPAASRHEEQFALVARTSFRLVPLLNYSEAQILPMLERIVTEIGQGHRVMAQVSMGEMLCALDGAGKEDFSGPANRAVNAKRLDFVIIDLKGMVVAAVEYQGSGHHLSDTAFMRDAVKREALRKAGLLLVELPAKVDEAHVRSLLAAQTTLPVALSAPAVTA